MSNTAAWYMDNEREPQRPKRNQSLKIAKDPVHQNDGIWRDVEVHFVRSKGSAEHQPRQLLPKCNADCTAVVSARISIRARASNS